MTNVFDVLSERGFIEQTTHDDELRDYFDNETVTCYIGFDPTASSLHIGSLVPSITLNTSASSTTAARLRPTIGI